jgi:hypothetical protein
VKIESILSKVFLLLFSFFIIFAGLEITLRTYLWHTAKENRFKRYASPDQLVARYGEEDVGRTYSPHRYLGFYPTPNFARGLNRHNSLGFRGEEFEIEKPEGAFRIACLGGSTTYGVLEDFRESFPYSLQQALHERGYTHVEATMQLTTLTRDSYGHPRLIRPITPRPGSQTPLPSRWCLFGITAHS